MSTNHFFNWFFEQYKGVEPHLVVLELLGVFFGLLSVFFSKKRNIWVYPTGIISTIIFVYLLWISRLLGDMLINAYYTIMSIYGWLLWARNTNNNINVSVSFTTRYDKKISLLLFVLSGVFVVGVYCLKPFINNDFSWEGVSVGIQYFTLIDWVDILTTSIFLVGMWLMAKRKIENWLFWIVGDIISVPLYYYKGLVFSSFQYLVFTIIAIFAYIEWKKSYLKEQQI